MPYLRNCYFPNTPRSNENAANEIAYGAAVCIEEIKERGFQHGYGLSLIVERSDSKHQFILTIEACRTQHEHEMAQDAATVAEHWVSPAKLRFLEADGQDALEEWCEGVVAGLREDADDDYREDNPGKSARLTAAQDAAFQEAVCDVEEEAGSDGYTPLQRRAGKSAALAAVRKHRDNIEAYHAARSAYFHAAEDEGNRTGRENNPSGHSTGMMVGVGIGAFIVGSMVTAASYNSVVVGPLFRRIQELEKKPLTP